MHFHSRTFFFWISVILCLATIGGIIFYSFGYRYQFGRGIFVYTGSISLKVNPASTIHFTLDNQSADAQVSAINNAYHLSGIRPGLHHITVSADGFQTWEKEVSVSSGVSTDFWNITLVRNTYNQTTLASQSSIQKFYPSPDQKFLAYSVQNEAEASVYTVNTQTGETQRVFSRLQSFFKSDNLENIEWSPESNAITLPLYTADTTRDYFIVSLSDESFPATRLIDITDAASAKDLRWDPQAPNTLLFLNNFTLIALSLDDSNTISLAKNVLGYDISGNTLYTFESPSFLIWQAPLDTPDDRTQITTQSIQNIQSDDNFSLIVYDINRAILLDRTKQTLTLLNNNPDQSVFTTLSQSVTDAQFSNDGKKLLFWNNSDISVYFLRDWNTQPARRKNQINEIARFSQPIHFVQWTKDYEHILLATPSDVELIEIDTRSRISQKIPLGNPSDIRQITPVFSANKLFFLKSSGDSSNNTSISSIPFPESIYRFGIIQQ
ncbi:MAG: carboxypeptidase-like regulatory domain-containing protein [Candidatus Moraniibacteriota bacterium]